VAVEVNWDAYFEGIKRVCPWSYADWHGGLIQIVPSHKPIDLGNYTARIYTVDFHSCFLRTYSDYLNNTRDDEWLYSDPVHGGNSTPVPTLIQQCPVRLEQIRQKTGTSAQEA